MSTKPNVSVTVRKDENIERALKRFKRMCERVGIRKIVRAKRYYEKPSDQRRRELRKRVRNRRRAEKKAKERLQRKLEKAKSKQRVGGSAMGEGGGGWEREGRDRDRDRDRDRY